MLDLNQAGEQKEATGGPIPPKSIVLVRLTLRPTKTGKTPGSDPLLTRADSGMEYLDCEFEVLSGTFTGKKIWDNLNLCGAREEGQKKSVDITTRLLRAMVEAVRNINPKDQSPAAVQARKLQRLNELQGIVFGVRVGIKKIKPGDKYVNNTIYRIITPDHEFYAQVMNGQELISSEPIPEPPQANASPSPGWAAPGAAPKPDAPVQGVMAGKWGTVGGQPTVTPPAAANPNPGWATPPSTQGPAFPSEASGMDDVPF